MIHRFLYKLSLCKPNELLNGPDSAPSTRSCDDRRCQRRPTTVAATPRAWRSSTSSSRRMRPQGVLDHREKKGVNVYIPGVTKECFLEALKYLKTSKKHSFVTLVLLKVFFLLLFWALLRYLLGFCLLFSRLLKQIQDIYRKKQQPSSKRLVRLRCFLFGYWLVVFVLQCL